MLFNIAHNNKTCQQRHIVQSDLFSSTLQQIFILVQSKFCHVENLLRQTNLSCRNRGVPRAFKPINERNTFVNEMIGPVIAFI